MRLFRPILLRRHPAIRWSVRIVVLAALGAVVAYPWTINWVVRLAAGSFGARLETVSTGYGGTLWRGVEWKNEGVVVRLAQLELASFAELLGVAQGDKGPLLEAADLVVTLRPAESPPPDASRDRFTPDDLFDLLSAIFGGLEKWLPHTTIEAARLEGLAGGAVDFGRLEWRAGLLAAAEVRWEGAVPGFFPAELTPRLATLTIERFAGDRFLLAAQHPAEIELGLGARRTPGADRAPWALDLGLGWPGGEVATNARLRDDRWALATASLTGEVSAFPWAGATELAALAPQLRFDGDYDGEQGRYTITLLGQGVTPPLEGEVSGEPWTARVVAAGDREALAVEALAMDLPWLRTALDEPLMLDLETLRPAQAVTLRWEVDFAASARLPGDGRASGRLSLEPAADLAEASFSLRGSGQDWALPPALAASAGPLGFTFSAEGMASRAFIEASRWELTSDELLALEGALRWDLSRTRLEQFTAEGEVRPALLGWWVEPEQVALSDDGLTLAAELVQTADGWEHAGTLEAARLTLAEAWTSGLKIGWQGEGPNLDGWELRLAREAVTLHAAGSLEAGAGGQLMVDRLREERTEGAAWSLTAPFALTWSPSPEGPLAADLSRLVLEREGGGRLELAGQWAGWPATELRVRVAELGHADAAPWLPTAELPELAIAAFEGGLRATPEDGDTFGWTSEGTVTARWVSPANVTWRASGGWELAPERTSFENLRLQRGGEDWLRLAGRLPMGWGGTIAEPFRARVDRDAEVSLEAILEPLAELPAVVAERVPFNAQGLQAELRASGTLRAPEASFTAEARRWEWTGAGRPVTIHDLALATSVAEDAVTVERLALTLSEGGEAQILQGRVAEIDWAGWIEDPAPARWLDLSASLEAQAWPLAALGTLLPEALEPTGTISLDLAKAPGDWPTGTFSLEGLASRPLAGGFVAREISGQAVLDGRRVETLALSGTIGGQPWNLDGWLDAEDFDALRYRVSLEAERLDLVRRADLIFRARADLELTREDPAQPALLSGEVDLLRSLWLRDLRGFTERGAAAAPRRPPYFAVEVPVLRDWRLDVELRGDRFLQVRSAVLTGEASADFRLAGTLGDPLLLGEAWIEEGAISFPFARLVSERLRGRITAEAPHTMQLSGGAGGVAYGYDVQMTLGGTATEPVLQFQSAPALPPDEILLMLATGAVPSSEEGLATTERAGRLALYLGQDFFSELIGASGASRLEVRSGEGFSPFRRDSRVIEYHFDDDWSILGEYDDFGDYNVDVRWKILAP